MIVFVGGYQGYNNRDNYRGDYNSYNNGYQKRGGGPSRGGPRGGKPNKNQTVAELVHWLQNQRQSVLCSDWLILLEHSRIDLFYDGVFHIESFTVVNY